MDPVLIVLAATCAVGIGISVFLQLRQRAPLPQQDLSKEIARLEQEKTRLEKDLEAERREKSELSGQGKQQFAQLKIVEAEQKALRKEYEEVKGRVTRFETRKEQMEKDHQNMVTNLKNAQIALEKERERVIHTDEERRRQAEEERDRMWAEHETDVIAALSDLCKQPQLQFTSYTNTKLPAEFDGTLKPDFLIEFLDQYVIFDAKVSKAKSLQTYIDDAVRKTSDKLKKNPKIYPHVFLVVPTQAIGELKKLIYAKDEFYFYVVSREALAPILASIKRISAYEFAEQLDPQKRENIINIIAELATHISFRNAHDILLTKHGADTLDRISHVDHDIATEVERKQSEKKLTQLLLSDIKRLAKSLSEQNIAVAQLSSPKAAIKKQAIDAAQLALVHDE